MMAESLLNEGWLGALLGDYQIRVGRRIANGMGVFVLLICASVTLMFGILLQAPTLVHAMIILVGLGLVGVAIRLFWRSVMAPTTRVRVYEHGFIAKLGKKTTVARWSDVTSIIQRTRQIRYRFRLYLSFTYLITLNTGESLHLSEFIDNNAAMGRIMRERITQAMEPQALAALRSGEPLPFGVFTLSLAGISKGSRLLPWSEVKGVSLSKGELVIAQSVGADKWRGWAASTDAKTPNVSLFIVMVEEMRRSAQHALASSD